MKICKDCLKSKQPQDFYGVQGECKECTKTRVALNYRNNRLHYIDYEHKREQRPERKAQKAKYQRRLRSKSPGKYRARMAVNNAIRDGCIVKRCCRICKNRKVEAHHRDYRKPLAVEWLCRKHHMLIESKIPF